VASGTGYASGQQSISTAAGWTSILPPLRGPHDSSHTIPGSAKKIHKYSYSILFSPAPPPIILM